MNTENNTGEHSGESIANYTRKLSTITDKTHNQTGRTTRHR